MNLGKNNHIPEPEETLFPRKSTSFQNHQPVVLFPPTLKHQQAFSLSKDQCSEKRPRKGPQESCSALEPRTFVLAFIKITPFSVVWASILSRVLAQFFWGEGVITCWNTEREPYIVICGENRVIYFSGTSRLSDWNLDASL